MMRDPRVEPRPGDVLQRTRKCIDCTRVFRREVIQRTSPNPSTGHEWVVCRNKSGHNAYMLGIWRQWAKYAEVIHAVD